MSSIVSSATTPGVEQNQPLQRKPVHFPRKLNEGIIIEGRNGPIRILPIRMDDDFGTKYKARVLVQAPKKDNVYRDDVKETEPVIENRTGYGSLAFSRFPGSRFYINDDITVKVKSVDKSSVVFIVFIPKNTNAYKQEDWEKVHSKWVIPTA